MSYSFNFNAANKAEAKARVAEELEKVAHGQVCHQRDKAQAQSAADAFIDLLDDDGEKDVHVMMSGSLTGSWQGSDVTCITGANLSVNAGLVNRQVPKD